MFANMQQLRFKIIPLSYSKLMTVFEIIKDILIHLVVPLAALVSYRLLVRKMDRENIIDPPTVGMIIVFATYGGLLLVVLTNYFWQWSGMASLGLAYLLLVAPFVMGGIAYRYYYRRHISRYHNAVFKAGILYFIILPACLLLVFLTE